MTGKLRIGIIGTGQIGKAHIRTYQEVPDCEIVAVADLREDEAQCVAEAQPVELSVEGEELLFRTRPGTEYVLSRRTG